MKKNLITIVLLLLTATWSVGQKSPKLFTLSGEVEKLKAASQSGFKTKQSVKSSFQAEGFYEGFEGSVFPPAGWKVINDGSSDRTWERYTDYPISGSASAYISYSSEAHDDWLITPPLHPIAGCNTFAFKAMLGDSFYPEQFNVMLSTTGNNKENFTVTLASNVGPTKETPETFVYDLSAYNGQTVYVAIQAISTDMYQLIVDDFTMTPTDLVVTGGNKDYRLIPSSQLDNAFTLKTVIVNQGQQLTENVNVTATLKNAGNTTLFTSTDVLNAGLAAGASQTVTAATPFNATTLSVGDYSYTHTAEYAADYNPTDNTDVFNFSVTDYVYARDAGVFARGVGGSGGKVTIGNLFNIINTATISGVQFVWAPELDTDIVPYQLALYKVDNSMNIVETIFTTKTYERTKDQEGQTINVKVTPKTLQPGRYVLAIKQLSDTRVKIAVDEKEYGFFYWADDPDNPTMFKILPDYGNTSLRMDFTPRNTVTFAVKDQTTTAPIEGATVTVKQGPTVIETVITNSEGKAEIYVVSGDYTYSVNASGYNAKNDIALIVNGEISVNVELNAATPPVLEVTPTPFTFVKTQIETSSAPQTFTMKNTGGGTVTVTPANITITGTDANQFTLTTIGNTVNLGPEKTATFTVAFTPTTVGDKAATIEVTYNLGTTHTLNINGSAADFTITDFPYKESFTNEDFPPTGWLNLGNYPWERVTSAPEVSGTPFGAFLKYNCRDYPDGSQGTLVLPRLNMGSGTYAVGFKMHRDGTYGNEDKVDVYINTQPNTTGATLLGTIHRFIYNSPIADTSGWNDYTFDIPAAFIQNPSFVILVGTGRKGANMFVDEFVVDKTNKVTFNVADNATNNPIEGATVTLKQGTTFTKTVTTDSEGKAIAYVYNGEYTYSADALGYNAKNDIALTIDQDKTVDVALEPLPPALEVTPASHAFPDTQIGASSAPQTFTLKNTGGGTVTINPADITLTGADANQFTLTTIGSTVNLGAGETATFTVAFTPATVGDKAATIEVTYNSGGTHTINISGKGVDFTVTTFPYTETFDAEDFPPTGWLSLGEKPWVRVTSGTNPTCAPFGTGMLKYNGWDYSTGSQGTVISRRLNMGGSEAYGVGFKMYRSDIYTDRPEKVDIYINTQPDIAGATLLGTIHRPINKEPVVSTAGWYDYVFGIPTQFIDNPSYVMLVGTSEWGANIYVDEFVVGKTSTITLLSNPNEGGTVEGGGNYIIGTEATLTATPNTGYSFKDWTDASNTVVATTASFDYTVTTEDVTFTANFDTKPAIKFTVVDSDNNPIEGASIEIDGTLLITDAAGTAAIELTAGTYNYTVTKLDYIDVTANTEVTTTIVPVTVIMLPATYDPFDLTANVINGNQAQLSWNPSFADDIESYDDFIINNIGSYTLIDGDGLQTYSFNPDFTNNGYTGSFIVFNPSTTNPPVSTEPEIAPHSGSKFLACVTAEDGSNNDWLITHQVTVAPGMRFSFWAKSLLDNYGLERFKVGVSTTGTQPSDFTFITAGSYVEAPTEWTQYTFSLDAYAGQQIYLAINCVSDNANMLMVDDIYIGGPMVGNSATFTGFNVYLNNEVKATGITATEFTITDIPNGTHTVGVEAVYGSQVSEIVTTSINVQNTGTGTLSVADGGNNVQLYPNPVKNTLTIERNNSDNVTIELYNINGLLIGTTHTESRTTTLNVGELSSGSYFVKIIGTDKTPTVRRFIKQ